MRISIDGRFGYNRCFSWGLFRSMTRSGRRTGSSFIGRIVIKRSIFWEKLTDTAYEGAKQLKIDRKNQQMAASICWKVGPGLRATLNTNG
ncbi:hypothetical protein LINPERPRIM_LOCUS40319 [Linum perenne]